MNPKLKAIMPAFAFLIAQAPVVWAMRNAILAARRNWNAVLGADRPLPLLTDLSLRFGLWIPAITTVGVGVLLFGYYRNHLASPMWLIAGASCELAALSFFAFGIVEPALYIQFAV